MRAAVERLIAPEAPRFQLMPALMAWEVRPRGGQGVARCEALMRPRTAVRGTACRCSSAMT